LSRARAYLGIEEKFQMQSAIVIGMPWLRGGTLRVMQMQLKHLHDLEYRTVFAAVPSSYSGGFDKEFWQEFLANGHELGADEIEVSGFDDLNPLRKLGETARAWKNRYNAMHWALAPAHFAKPSPRLETILATGDVRILLANHVYAMPYAVKLQRILRRNGKNVPLVVVTHDVQSHILMDRKASAPWSFGPEKEALLVSTELEWLSQSDALVHVSNDDFVFFSRHLPQHRHHLMLPALPAMDLRPLQQNGAPKRDLLYVGVDHFGNVESLKWYFEYVVPHFKEQPPSLTLIGQICDAKQAFLPRGSNLPWLNLMHDVDDLRPYYANSKAALGVTTRGRGISIKTIEAFSAGLPIAGTELAFRGIPKQELQRFGIRSEVESQRFAELIIDILKDEKLEIAARASRGIYKRLFTPAHSFTSFVEVLKALGLSTNDHKNQ
jgi:Glycosyl transferases group 1